jgi:hypothetical protein
MPRANKMMIWSDIEDQMLLRIIDKHKESKATYELVAQALNIVGENGSLHPFRTARACKRRFRQLRGSQTKELTT